MKSAFLPVVTVVLAIIAFWYVAALPMNIHETLTAAENAGISVNGGDAKTRAAASGIVLALENAGLAAGGWSLDRPRLPAPHQVAAEFYETTIQEEVFGRRGFVQSGEFSKKSLIYHGGITLSATLLGFVIGTALGILLAVGIVHSRTMDMSVMPWAIVSQTIPIIAIAPMIIVVMYAAGIQGIIPKAVISAYLSFFPVVVGMVKGLRSPDQMQLDLLQTYNASKSQGFWKLRLPSSVPYLFASLKIGISASLVGAIVGELPTGAVAGLGARMLAGSYYGQTAQIWAALFAAAILAASLVGLISLIERRTLRRMGVQP
ncbi:MAG: ABC transporter permease subunit [Rhodobacterales bacterium]|nr:ABC transporter permease subunit [Rhodobacterales bacterium]